MIKLKNKPKNNNVYFDCQFFTLNGGKMNKYTDGKHHYIEMNNQWFKVSVREYEEETELFCKLALLNGEIYEIKRSEDVMCELGLLV